jgi:hypothetical protein
LTSSVANPPERCYYFNAVHDGYIIGCIGMEAAIVGAGAGTIIGGGDGGG